MIIGIDPGVSGAIACLTDDGEIKIIDTPTEKRKSGKVNRSHYLIPEMVRIIDELMEYDACCGLPMGGTQVVIEHVHSMPRDGVVQAFSLGYGFGLWCGILEAKGLAPHMVPPQTWKKKLKLSGEKDDSRLSALHLYPHARVFLNLKKHHNRAEALLLAHYLKESLCSNDSQKKQ